MHFPFRAAHRAECEMGGLSCTEKHKTLSEGIIYIEVLSSVVPTLCSSDVSVDPCICRYSFSCSESDVDFPIDYRFWQACPTHFVRLFFLIKKKPFLSVVLSLSRSSTDCEMGGLSCTEQYKSCLKVLFRQGCSCLLFQLCLRLMFLWTCFLPPLDLLVYFFRFFFMVGERCGFSNRLQASAGLPYPFCQTWYLEDDQPLCDLLVCLFVA